MSSAETEMNPEGQAKFLEEYITGGGDPSKIKLWWHSHAQMGVFWSATDDKAVEEFSDGWMISIVGNHKGDFRVRLDWYDPVRFTLDKLNLAAQHFFPQVDEDGGPSTALTPDAHTKREVKGMLVRLEQRYRSTVSHNAVNETPDNDLIT